MSAGVTFSQAWCATTATATATTATATTATATPPPIFKPRRAAEGDALPAQRIPPGPANQERSLNWHISAWLGSLPTWEPGCSRQLRPKSSRAFGWQSGPGWGTERGHTGTGRVTGMAGTTDVTWPWSHHLTSEVSPRRRHHRSPSLSPRSTRPPARAMPESRRRASACRWSAGRLGCRCRPRG